MEEEGSEAMKIYIPVKTVSEANTRCHYMVRAKRVKKQRSITTLCLNVRLRGLWLILQFPLKITLTRIAPGKLDSDNLCSSLKAVRDAVAKAIEVDDGSDKVAWLYSQRKGKEYGVEVEIT